MYKIQKIGLSDISGQIKVNHILFDCGKDMAQKYDLHHWDNSHLKNAIIIVLCVLKNRVFLVMDEKKPVATFQIQVAGRQLWFMKLATEPVCSGRGIGSFCMDQIEQEAIRCGCRAVYCEVYERSKHAVEFYEQRGYVIKAKKQTLKYTELIMEKVLGE